MGLPKLIVRTVNKYLKVLEKWWLSLVTVTVTKKKRKINCNSYPLILYDLSIISPSLIRRFSLPTLSPASFFSSSASFPNLTVSFFVLIYWPIPFSLSLSFTGLFPLLSIYLHLHFVYPLFYILSYQLKDANIYPSRHLLFKMLFQSATNYRSLNFALFLSLKSVSVHHFSLLAHIKISYPIIVSPLFFTLALYHIFVSTH